ncbi:hypothetical protein F5883DRAFT_651482 [Diaporthe sp. PMI_573]|nr:hypothetical protein F5883DRAFT_651482 [Diaporthaceae sp. PMI_573]
MSDNQHDTKTTSGPGKEADASQGDRQELPQAAAEAISGPVKEAEASEGAVQASEGGANEPGPETISGPVKEAEASEGALQASEGDANKPAKEAISGPGEEQVIKIEIEKENEIMATEEPKAAVQTNSGPGKKIRGAAVIPAKMRNAKSGAAVDWEREPHGDYTSFKMPMSNAVAYAAHFVDRSYGPQFTASVITFLDANWDDSKPMARQTWYRKLQADRVPDMLDIEAARAINGGEIPDGISKAVMKTPHAQNWFTPEQKKAFDEQEKKDQAKAAEKAADKKRKASFLLSLKGKKFKKNVHFDDDDGDGDKMPAEVGDL